MLDAMMKPVHEMINSTEFIALSYSSCRKEFSTPALDGHVPAAVDTAL